jgi:hypothetical protein
LRLDTLKRGALLVRRGRADDVLTALKLRLSSDTLSIGLHRDLTRAIEAPQSKIPVTVRPLVDADQASFQAAIRGAHVRADTRELKYLTDRLRMLEVDLGTGYGAVDAHGGLCYVQWLVTSDENRLLQKFFKHAVPALKADEALLENAYTFEQFRGQGIMACAMAQIAQRASDSGARWVMTFVAEDNVPSLIGCKRAGFEPFITRRRSTRLLRQRYTFEPLRDTPPAA